MEFFRGVVLLLLVFTFGQVFGQEPKVKLTISPDKDIEVGINATLTCNVTGKTFLDIVRIAYVRDGKDVVIGNIAVLAEEFKKTGRYHLAYGENSGDGTLTLTISDVQESDLGKYRCILLGDTETDDSVWLQRNRPSAPKITISSSSSRRRASLYLTFMGLLVAIYAFIIKH